MNKTWLKTGWRPTALLLTVSAFTLTLLAASGMATSAVADELFTVVYEKKIISSDEETVSATLILHVTNVSGQDVNDVVAWVSGMNNITYDNHPVMIGNLAEAETKGILDEFTVPTVMTEMDIPEGMPPAWIVEYTDLNGNRNEAEVEGMAID